MGDRLVWRLATLIAACGVLLALEALPAHAQTCLPPPNGLIAWWPGDGNANDIIGGHNGTLLNATYGTVSQGHVSQAFSFSGSGQVSIASAPTSNDFTINAWVYPRQISSLNGYRTIYADNARGLWLWNGRINWWSPSTDRFMGNNPAIPTMAWTHVALTYSNGVFTGYRNGVFDGSSNSAGEFLPALAGIGIGGHGGGGEPFDGFIDEVGIFNRALAQSEIQAIYAAGKAGKCKPGSRGMTWVLGAVNATTGTVTVGCGNPPNRCDPIAGDRPCTDSLPLLCFKPLNLPVPAGVNNTDVNNRWSGGIIGTTAPIQASSFGGLLASANARCVQEFGSPDWRVAEFHDGAGWNFQAFGNVGNSNSRFWVHINDQKNGTCFTKP